MRRVIERVYSVEFEEGGRTIWVQGLGVCLGSDCDLGALP